MFLKNFKKRLEKIETDRKAKVDTNNQNISVKTSGKFFQNMEKAFSSIVNSMGKDIDIILRAVHITFAVVIYFFATGNTERVPILILTTLAILIIIGYGLSYLKDVTETNFKTSKYIYYGMSIILFIVSVIMFFADSKNLGMQIFYNLISHDVLIWWFLFGLSGLFLYLGSAKEHADKVHNYIVKEFNTSSSIVMIKLLLVFVGIIFSLYNNLKATCSSGGDQVSGGQTAFLIVLNIVYTVLAILDGLLLYVDLNGEFKLSKMLCE